MNIPGCDVRTILDGCSLAIQRRASALSGGMSVPMT